MRAGRPGNPLGIVHSEDELLYGLRYPLDLKATVDDGKLRFTLVSEALKVFFEQKLDGVDSPQLIDRRPDCIELKGQLSFHIEL